MFKSSFFIEGNFSFRYYYEIFTDTRQMHLFFRSLNLAFLSTFLSILIGVPFAFIISRTDMPCKKIFFGLLLLPLCIPPHIHTVSWIYLFGQKGLINLYLMNLFSLTEPVFNICNVTGSAIILCLSYFPFIVLLTLSGLNSIDQRYEDAGRLLYNWKTVLGKITLPLVLPYIFTGAVFIFIFTLFNYGVPALLQVNTYPIEIFAQFSAFYNEGKATAESLPLIMIALLLLYVQRRYMGMRAYVTIDTSLKKGSEIKLSGFQKSSAFLFLLFVILFSVLLPIIVLLFQAGPFESYIVAFRTSYDSLMTTLMLSIIAAICILFLTYFISVWIEEKKYKRTYLIDYITFIPFAFPATVLGIGLIYLWNNSVTDFIYQSFIILIIAYIARFIPFAIRIFNATIKQISPSLRESAYLYEKNWFKRFIKIDLPLLKNGIAVSWVIVFILCMSELGATLLVIPPGKGTVSLKIYTLMHYGANKLVAALSIILILLNILIPSAVLFWVQYKGKELK